MMHSTTLHRLLLCQSCLHSTIFSVLSVADIPSAVYWRSPFSSLCNHRQLTEFYVLHIEKATPTHPRGSTSNLTEKVSITSRDTN